MYQVPLRSQSILTATLELVVASASDAGYTVRTMSLPGRRQNASGTSCDSSEEFEALFDWPRGSNPRSETSCAVSERLRDQ
jgi:hypothetical protein